MSRGVSVLALLLALSPQVYAADTQQTFEGLISANPLPTGYKLTRHNVSQAGVGAVMLNVDKQKASPKDVDSPKAMILIGQTEISDNESRVKWVRGYLGGVTKHTEKEGFKLISNDGPDLAKADLTKPYVAMLTYVDPSGKNRYLKTRVFFARVAYHVGVTSASKDAMNALWTWAESVKEK